MTLFRCDCVAGEPAQFRIEAQILPYCRMGLLNDYSTQVVSVSIGLGFLSSYRHRCFFLCCFSVDGMYASLFLPRLRFIRPEKTRERCYTERKLYKIFLGNRRHVLLPTLFKKRPPLRSHRDTKVTVVEALLNKQKCPPGFMRSLSAHLVLPKPLVLGLNPLELLLGARDPLPQLVHQFAELITGGTTRLVDYLEALRAFGIEFMRARQRWSLPANLTATSLLTCTRALIACPQNVLFLALA